MRLLDAINRFYYDMALKELRLMNADLVDANVTYHTLLYLDLIHYQPNCTVSFLAEALHISKPAVTSKVNDLIRQGLVEKQQSQTDKRVYYLSVAAKTKARYEAYDAIFDQAVEKLEQDCTPEEVAVCCHVLQKFSKYYQEEGFSHG